MAINYTVSYAFSPNTTISSSQVNTNFNDNANTWNGLEALTKTFAKLKIDVDPSTALEVATKQYVDHYSTWRRPVLQFSSVTAIAVEAGLDGTSGNIPMLFPDGSVRTETSTTRTTFDITRNAVLTTSGAQSGLRTSLSEATNTWYALYAVKVTDSSAQWCTVGDTVLPLQANYATLNSNYGTSGWVYLGMIRNGDGSGGTTGDILYFKQAGSIFKFKNVTSSGNVLNSVGILEATTASASSLTWNPSNGTGNTDVPSHFEIGWALGAYGNGTSPGFIRDSSGSTVYLESIGTAASGFSLLITTDDGLKVTNGSAVTMDIFFQGWVDGVLGVGSNPLL